MHRIYRITAFCIALSCINIGSNNEVHASAVNLQRHNDLSNYSIVYGKRKNINAILASSDGHHIEAVSDLLKDDRIDKKIKTMVSNLSKSMARLYVRIRYDNKGNIKRHSGGSFCTSWKINSFMYVTNYHCLHSSLQCAETTITRGYDPKLARLQPRPHNRSRDRLVRTAIATEKRKSHRWGTHTANCDEIIYSNARLDVTIFTLRNQNPTGWVEKTPFIPIRPGEASFPVVESNKGDRIAVLHFPIQRGCTFVGRDNSMTAPAVHANFDDPWRAEYWTKNSRFQSELAISIFRNVSRQGRSECRVQDLSRKGGQGVIAAWPMIADPLSREEIGNKSRYSPKGRPSHALVHRCHTCNASSGAPLISLETRNGRFGTAVGLHVGIVPSNNEGEKLVLGNFALRLSRFAECIDFDKLQRENRLEATVGAEVKPYCRAYIPKKWNNYRCFDPNIHSNCVYYPARSND